MTDVVTKKKRSEMMSGIRGRGNKSTEECFVAILRGACIVGWRRHIGLRVECPRKRARASIDTRKPTSSKGSLVRPDFTFSKKKVVVFVDGCYWHQCPEHSSLPASNAEFWRNKLSANVERDRRTRSSLRRSGWAVVRVWEHELRNPKRVAAKVRRVLEAR